ncbi:MAG: metallophosphoesterase [Marinifilaceae bacterium]
MIIQYCSDLHLEFPENEEILRTTPIETKGDILILSGDIVPFVVLDKYMWFFEDLSAKFKYVYWIPGNHEYYYSDISRAYNVINEKILYNVYLVNNICLRHDGIKFIFSTLWSNISESNQYLIQNRLSDFAVIRNKDGKFIPSDYNTLHIKSLDFIKNSLKDSEEERIIVATHHVPTFYNYPDKYKSDILNQAFVCELYEFIESSNIDYWIFGHHHSNVPDFIVGDSILTTNQLGYVRSNEHLLFKTKYIKFGKSGQ